MSLSIIIPAYNEGHHIFQVLEDVAQSMLKKEHQNLKSEENFEMVVVNDGSFDHTLEEVHRFVGSRKDVIVRVVNHEKNKGYGAALKSGFDSAKNNYLSFMDGDGTINPDCIFDLYKGLLKTESDMAVGHRFHNTTSEMPFIRKVGNIFFARLLSYLSGESINDTASGIRVFHRSILKKLYPLPDGLHFTPAMSAKAVHEKVKILEQPVDYGDREGQSKLSVIKDGFRFLKVIMDTVLMYNPFKVFFLVGMLFECVGFALLIEPIGALIQQDQAVFSDYLYRSIGALCCLVGGMQIILFGILTRFMVSTFFRRYESGKWIHRINHRLKVYERMGYFGSIFLLVGMMIHTYYLSSYLFQGSLAYHWSWLGLGAIFFIIGLQMVITSVIMSVLKNIKESLLAD